MRLACLSIALSPLLVSVTLPTDAHGAGYTSRAEVIWSTRDGQLRSRQSTADKPDLETGGEPTGGTADTEPSPWERGLVCEPFR
jgi:hypothetical protein